MSIVELLKKANLQEQKGQWQEAIATYHQAIQNNPKFHWSHYHLGKALEQQGRLDEAILWYCQAIEINPKFFPGYCRLGQTFYLLTQQNQELSSKHYQSITSCVDSNFATELLLLDDAVFLEKTKHLNNEEFLKQIYLTYLGREADVQGLQHHLQSLEGSHPISRKDMIQLNFRKSNEFANVTRFSKLEMVVNIYKKALAIVPDSCSVYYKLAQALETQSKWAEAIEVYRKILEINPEFVPAVNQLQVLFHVLGEHPKMIEEIKKIIPNQLSTSNKRKYYSRYNSSSPSRYLFIHIPKTGGSLINGLIEQLFLPEECLLFLFNDSFYTRYQYYSEANWLKKVRFFAGHISYDLTHLVGADYKITFLRNPIDRVLSHYFYYRKIHINCNLTIDFNGNPCPLIDYNLSWEEDLLRHLAAPTLKSLEFINLQTWQLAFNIYNRPHEIWSDREVLEMAKQHLDDFNFVGIYERLNSDLARLFQEQGWKLPEQLERVNATVERKQISEIDSHVIDVIRSQNALDIELYDYALNKFGSIL